MPERKATLAKLTRPRLVGIEERERLFALLDDRLAHPAAWITGPPGSGKTTLLSGYAQARKRPTLWYQFDGGDADVASFFHYIGLAAQPMAGRRRLAALPALTPEYLPDLEGFTRRFFRLLFARLPPRALLALDDYHEIPTASPLHRVIAGALTQLPEGVNCVIASRMDCPPELARLVANGNVVTLGWEDLRLTSDEAADIAKARKITDEAIVSTARQRADGWVAGLILLLDQAANAQPAAAVLAPTSKSLFDYFDALLQHSFTGEVRDLLTSVAFADHLTERVAVLVSGNENAGRRLRELHERNYFVGRRAGDEPTYQLHALFREYLAERVAQSSTPTERREMLQRTARALAVCGESGQAIARFTEAGDWASAIDLMLPLAPGLLVQGRWQTLQRWIAAFPAAEVRSTPWLRYWQGASQMATDPIGAQATLINAFEGFEGDAHALGRVLTAATIIEIEFLLWNDFTNLDRWIGVLDDAVKRGMPLPDAETEIRMMTNLVQALTFRSPWHPSLPAYAARLLLLANGDAAPSVRVFATAALSHHYSWFGSLECALKACAIARPLLTRDDVLPAHKLWIAMSLAYAAYARADHDDADALFARAFAIAEEHGLHYIAAWMRAADCWHRLDRGEYKAVSAALHDLESVLATGRGLNVAHFHLVKGWLALLEGHWVTAGQSLEAADEMSTRAGATYTATYHVLMRAEVLIELGDYAQASACVARVRTTFDRVGSPMIEFNALQVEAYLALRQGDEGGCADALRAAFALGQANGYVTTYNWYAKMMSCLCAFALEHAIEVEYATALIRRRELKPIVPTEAWPWPVRIRALGAFELHTDGEEWRARGKTAHKPIALAKALVALGGRDVSADKLVDALWPEPSESDGRKALEITVHRLRKLLGSDEAVLIADRRVTLNPDVVWVDVWALERTLAPLIPAVNAPEPSIDLLAAAAPEVMNLYRGHLLAGDPEEAWQVPLRNRLTGRFQRFVLRLGGHWESQREWRRALELYQRAVDLDPLAESFYRRQMVCLQAEGQRAEALEVFRRCRQALSITLGIAPGAETEAIYRQLLAG